MKGYKQTILPLILVVACLCGGCRIGDTEYVIRPPKIAEDTSVFSVNGSKIELPEAMIYVCNYKNLYGSEYGMNLWECEFDGESLEDYVKDMAIAELARIACMDLLAKEREMELSEEEQEAVLSLSKEYYASLSEAEIAFMGIKESDVVLAYEHYALAMKLYKTLTTGVEREVSDDEARVIRMQQIVVSQKENADIVAAKLVEGDDFSTVAGSYNEADVLERVVARGELPKEVEEVAFELDNGSVSDMIAVDTGFYFVRCINKFEEELTEENKEIIRAQREKQQFEDAYNTFVGQAVFISNEKVWDAVTLTDMEEVILTDSFFGLYDKYF